MKVNEINVGDLYEILLCPDGSDTFNYQILDGQEARLTLANSLDEVILSIGENQWPVRGDTSVHNSLLIDILAQRLPFVCSVASTQPKGSITNKILLSIRQFTSRHILPSDEEIHIRLIDSDFDKLRKNFIRRTQLSNKQVLEWIEDHAILNIAGRSLIMISVGSETKSNLDTAAFRIYGQRIAIDVERQDDYYRISRLIQFHGTRGTQPILLVEGVVSFDDASVATQYHHSGMTELDNIVTQSESYLSIWREYNQLERKILIDRARQFGWIYYHNCTPLPDGWRLYVRSSDKTKLEQIDILEETDFEVSDSLPKEFDDEYSLDEDDEEVISNRDENGLAIHCNSIDSDRGFIDISTLDPEESKPPSKKGYLFTSMSGDRVRLRRRTYAWKRIREGRNPIPLLALLLERSEKYVSRSYPIQKVERKELRRAFGGDPTPKQTRAIEIALNTPDIALIQGPPGTGKTRVITALNKILSGERMNRGETFGQILLTSYQHDAVENVSNLSQVFGLPALKFGRRRFQDIFVDQTEMWSRQMVRDIRSDPLFSAMSSLSTASHRVHSLLLGYIRSPGTPQETSRILRDIFVETNHLLPELLSNSLLELSRRLNRDDSFNSLSIENEKEIILRAARALRTSPSAFSDDGPENAYILKKRIWDRNFLKPEELAILQIAADWDNQEIPGFLGELEAIQQKVISQLTAPALLDRSNLVNADVEELLSEIDRYLMVAIQNDQNHPEAIVEQFTIDLENDPIGVRNAIWHYTAVLAATCQQSVGRSIQFAKHIDDKESVGLEFETVIVDEAARSNPLDLLIPISLANRRIILVGDHRQLPHILELDVERNLEKSSEATREVLGKSLFERLFNYLRERERVDGISRTVTLDQQYRMHPDLGRFVSRTFYERHDLSEAFGSDSKPANEFTHNIDGYQNRIAGWIDVPSNYGREKGVQSKYRIREAKVIADEVKRILDDDTKTSIGVITFYAAQVQKILFALKEFGLADDYSGELQVNQRLLESGIERLRVGTVDAFQGKEFDVVFLSVVRCNDFEASENDELAQRRKYGFLTLENRLCVAMSRQKKLLIAVGDSEMVKHPSALNAVPGLAAFFNELCKEPYGIVQRI